MELIDFINNVRKEDPETYSLICNYLTKRKVFPFSWLPIELIEEYKIIKDVEKIDKHLSNGNTDFNNLSNKLKSSKIKTKFLKVLAQKESDRKRTKLKSILSEFKNYKDVFFVIGMYEKDNFKEMIKYYIITVFSALTILISYLRILKM